MRYIVIVLALLVSRPTWGQQKHKTISKEKIRRLGYEEKTSHKLYFELVGLGCSFSKSGPYLDGVVFQVGRYWPKLFGIEGAIMETLVKTLGSLEEREEDKRIYSWLPFGVYLPILTVNRPGFWQGSVLTLSVRAHMWLQYSHLEVNHGAISHSTPFPPFIDVSLEWRGFLHTINVGYRYQTKPFEYGCKGWPHNLHMSGVFASVRVGFGGGATGTFRERLPSRPVKRIEALYYEGEKFYNQNNFHRAAQKWEQALKIAKDIKAERWKCFLFIKLGATYYHLGEYYKATSYYWQANKMPLKGMIKELTAE